MTELPQQDSQKPVNHQPPAVEKSPAEKNDARHQWQRGFATAWMVLGAAPAGLFIGYFIDRAYDTTPAWMLGLSLLFLFVTLYQLIKDSRK